MKLNGAGTLIKINGTNIDLGEALPYKIREELLCLAKTHFGRLNHATVGLTRDGHSNCCTINVQVDNLKVIVAEASAADCQQAFDEALAKIGRQLRRRKRRLADVARREMPVLALA